MAGQRRPRAAKRKTVSAGQRIIAGIKEAIAGNFVRATIDGQTWERISPAMKREMRIRKIMNRCTECRTFGDGNYLVRLKIDHQSFTIDGVHDKQHANFYWWHNRPDSRSRRFINKHFPNAR